MSKEQGHNGWANYETWLVKLWMDNDQSTYNFLSEVVVNYKGRTYDLAVMVRSAVEDVMIPELNGLASDLMNASLTKVNWIEIAESILKELGDTK